MRWMALLLLAAACSTEGPAGGDDAGVAMCERTRWDECGTPQSPNRCISQEQIPCSSCSEVCSTGKPCKSGCILSGMRCEDDERTHTACRPL
jgi:hypothetical protein